MQIRQQIDLMGCQVAHFARGVADHQMQIELVGWYRRHEREHVARPGGLVDSFDEEDREL